MGRRRRLAEELARVRPELDDPTAVIASGRVTVDGAVVTNPASMVLPGAAIVVAEPSTLRGLRKLAWALEHFGVEVRGRVALDVGAAAGGFTRALLDAGAARVYAVDVGHGQLLGSLRQDPRVVNLEATNVGDLSPEIVPGPVDLVTVDVSYLSLARAAGQLAGIVLGDGADLVGLVKPMFELRLGAAPADAGSLEDAVSLAVAGVAEAGWEVAGTATSPFPGARGAIEGFLHAVDASGGP